MDREALEGFDAWLDEPTTDAERVARAAAMSLDGQVEATEDELTPRELAWIAEMERIGRIQTEEVLSDADQVQPGGTDPAGEPRGGPGGP